MSDIEVLMRDLIKAKCIDLSLWNCKVDGKVRSLKGEPLSNSILMCYYFNLGFDAKLIQSVENNRQKYRICN